MTADPLFDEVAARLRDAVAAVKAAESDVKRMTAEFEMLIALPRQALARARNRVRSLEEAVTAVALDNGGRALEIYAADARNDGGRGATRPPSAMPHVTRGSLAQLVARVHECPSAADPLWVDRDPQNRAYKVGCACGEQVLVRDTWVLGFEQPIAEAA